MDADNLVVGVFLLVGMLMGGCTSTVDLDDFGAEPVVVMNSLLLPHENITVYFSKTTALSGNDTIVPDMEMELELYVNGLLVDAAVKKKNSNVYTIDCVPLPGNAYRVKATDLQTGNTLEAVDSIPNETEILLCKNTYPVYTDSYETIFGKTTLRFWDNPNAKNYYELLLLFNGNSVQTIKITHPIVTVDSESGIYMYPTILFADDLFNGQKPELDIYSDANNPQVVLRTVSYNYYCYKKYLYDHFNYINNVNSLILSGDAVGLYSNVAGGLGIFAGYTETRSNIEK